MNNTRTILRTFVLYFVFIQLIGIAGAISLTQAGNYDTAGIAWGVTVANNYAYVADTSHGLVIVDISNPTAPTLAGSYDTAGSAFDVTIAGNYAYIADYDNGLVVVDISNPMAPTHVGSYNTAGDARGVTLAGNYAYIADYDNGLVVVDISNPTTPTRVGSYNTVGFASGVIVAGNYAYVADGYNGLVVVDISNPTTPTPAGNYNTAGFARGVTLAGNYAYVADDNKGLVIVNINNPTALTLAGSYDTAGSAVDVSVAGNYAYVADGDNGLVAVDISNPTALKFAGSYDIGEHAFGVTVAGNYVYVDDGNNGLYMLSTLPPGSISVSSSPSDVSVYLDGVYKGTTPLTITSVSPRSYTIKLTNVGYIDKTKTINVISHGTTYVSETLTLILPTGSISVSSIPSGANIYLDDVYKGTTPLTLNSVSTDTHTVKLTKSGYNDVSSTVTVSSGQTVFVSKEMHDIPVIDDNTPAQEVKTVQVVSTGSSTGSISVSSNPSTSNVYLDGTYKGTTPTTLSNVPIGSHTVKLTKSGHNDVSSTVTVSSGQTASISKTLLSSVEDVPVKSSSVEKGFLTNTTIVGALLLALLFFGMILKRSRKSSNSAVDATTFSTPKPNESKKSSISTSASIAIAKDNALIKTSSAFSYKGATIQYKIKVENPTSEPIGDIKVNLYVPDVFLVSESTKTIVMLKPYESKTVTFEIRPTGECGDCEVSGKVVYYDYSTRKTSDIEIPAKNLSIVCPMLRGKEISESEWHDVVSNFVETEESTREIDMSAETLFTMVSRIVKDMHMHPLNPEITDSPQLYNGVSRFYGEGVKGLKYAAQVEVVGGAKKSKLILKTWAEKEEALTGFYHGLLDEIEKRVQVKGYINDSIVQNFHHHGDNIGTQVKDSFVQRSNIGTGADVKKCPNCSRDVDANEKFCLECGTKL